MKRLLYFVFLLTTVPAYAQQQPAVAAQQALGKKLMQEIQAGLNCSEELISLQEALAKAQARIKELEPKTEPPK